MQRQCEWRWWGSRASWLRVLAVAADWPQWRGLNRAAKVTDFKAPAVWPSQLTAQKWKVTVGDG